MTFSVIVPLSVILSAEPPLAFESFSTVTSPVISASSNSNFSGSFAAVTAQLLYTVQFSSIAADIAAAPAFLNNDVPIF